ncbi:membrane protein [Rubrivivax pictus]|uniref:Membrane protein n=1 Tax=Pseudaquabacterium pictum TaxID=2315236 RepID=A0A480AZC6_9BURK|nr:membrane protein [Rubrivivax pictus]
MSHSVRKYIIAGLLVWLPLAITIWVLLWLLGLMDGVFAWLLTIGQHVLPQGADASIEALRRVPFLGVVVMALLLLATGVFVTNIFGQWWVKQWDRLLSRIPIVKSIYSSVKQVSDTLFSSSGNAFREAVLVQYPHPGSWTIAFVTGKPGGEVAANLDGDHVSLYVPTTPNPTSGFFLMMPRANVRPLRMSVDEALKYIISMGVVAPPPPAPPRPLPAAAAPRN